MYSQSPGTEYRPLLPQPVAYGLSGLVLRLIGLGLLGAGLLCWLALLSWSAQDPSLTHAAGGSARNWAGPLGAMVSDLLLQTLGFAALFGLLAPAIWGYDLIAKGVFEHMRWRLVILPLAVLMMAGGLSALPIPTSWPLHHGLGGMLGDVVFRLVAGLLATLNPGRAGTAAGLVLLAGGMAGLASGLGISYQDFDRLMRQRPRLDGAWWASVVQPASQLFGKGSSVAGALCTHLGGAVSGRLEPSLGPANAGSPSHGRSASDTSPRLRGRGDEFDVITERDTRKIAATFAPEPPKPGWPGLGGALGDMLRRRKPLSDAASQAYRAPSFDALRPSAVATRAPELSQVALRGTGRLLQDALVEFGVHSEIRAIRPGPVVTEFEIELAPGTRANRVMGLADDIAHAMDASGARITAAPGGAVLCIELANVDRQPVMLRDILEHAAFRDTPALLPLALGKSSVGAPIVLDLSVLQHVLVAGGQDCGQASALRSMVLSLVYGRSPLDCRLMLIDTDRQTLAECAGLPHSDGPAISDPARAVAAISWLAGEVETRSGRIAAIGARTIDDYNARVQAAQRRGEPIVRKQQTGFDERTGTVRYEAQTVDAATMPRLVAVITELADLMAVGAPDVEDALKVLSRKGALVGVHLIVATGRPSVGVLSDTVRQCLPTRLAVRTASRNDGRVILGETGAEQLLGQGDMLLTVSGGPLLRLHGAEVTQAEIVRVVADLCPDRVAPVVHVETNDPAGQSPVPDLSGIDEDRYERAVAIATRARRVSLASLEQRLVTDHGQLAAILARLQRNGVVGPADPSGWHSVPNDASGPFAAHA